MQKITVEDNKKIMNIANVIHIYTNIPILYLVRMTQNKKRFKKLSSAVWSCCCIIFYFKISIFDPVSPIVLMEGSYHLLRPIKIFLSMKIFCC